MIIALNHQVDVLILHRFVWYELYGIRAVAAAAYCLQALCGHTVDGAALHVPVERLIHILSVYFRCMCGRDKTEGLFRTIAVAESPVLVFRRFFGRNGDGVGNSVV